MCVDPTLTITVPPTNLFMRPSDTTMEYYVSDSSSHNDNITVSILYNAASTKIIQTITLTEIL